MSEPETCGSHGELDPDQQLEVSAVFVSEKLPASGQTGRKPTGKSTQRHSKVFVTGVASLTATGFARQAVSALALTGAVQDGSVLPFTYHHKGRAAKYAISVTTEQDFELMIQSVVNRNLSTIIAEFLEDELKKHGVGVCVPDEASEQAGLASHVGIPRVDAMSSLEVDRARIIQALQKKWPSCGKEGHRNCYIKGNIHGRLTHTLLSAWAGYVHDHVATILEPPKAKQFDFSAHQKEIDTRTQTEAPKDPSSVSSDTVPPHPTTSVVVPPPALTEFLDFVRREHGIESGAYVGALARDRMGPDVMGELEVVELVGYGIPRGDAYRLKHAALAWQTDGVRPAKKSKSGHGVTAPPHDAPAHFQIAFDDNPPPPPLDYERSEAERAGRPRPGTQGNFCWQQKYPGEEGGLTFWADMPSPSLDPADPILARPGTVKLRVAAGVYIDVPRAPRPEILEDLEDEDGFKI